MMKEIVLDPIQPDRKLKRAIGNSSLGMLSFGEADKLSSVEIWSRLGFQYI